MTEYDELLRLAEDDLQFLHHYQDCWFLARMLRLGDRLEGECCDRFAFKTIEEATDATNEVRWEVPLVALVKRRGSPFRNRISIGRAPNCDVVVRLPFVSKLHAHVLIDGDERSIQDAGSSRGTFLNGKRLAPHEPEPLSVDDELTFGVQPTRVVDSRAALRLLQMQSSGP